jgi:hypothetical protein
MYLNSQKAKTMTEPRTINFRGKPYERVVSRVDRFKNDFPNWPIVPQPPIITDEYILFRTEIYDDEGKIVSAGHALKKRGQEENAFEKCETKSVGRALAFLGYAGEELASAEEIEDVSGFQDER